VPAVSLDVGGEDGDELAFETGRFHHGLHRAEFVKAISQRPAQKNLSAV
jgi:hypothetical protein